MTSEVYHQKPIGAAPLLNSRIEIVTPRGLRQRPAYVAGGLAVVLTAEDRAPWSIVHVESKRAIYSSLDDGVFALMLLGALLTIGTDWRALEAFTPALRQVVADLALALRGAL